MVGIDTYKALAVFLLLSTGPSFPAETSGWQAICTTVPGERRDYCEVSRTVIQKTEDGTKTRITLTIGFIESIIYSRALPLQGSLGKMLVKVRTDGGRLGRVSVKIKSRDLMGEYERTVSCGDVTCTFRDFSASVIAGRMEWASRMAKKTPDPAMVAIIKLRFASPLRIIYANVPLAGLQEAIRSTRE